MKRTIDELTYHVEWLEPSELIPYEHNSKLHDKKNVENIANSIKRYGWQQNLTVTKDKVIIIGHGRQLAALKLGCKVPCKVIEDDLTDDEIKELRIADNLTHDGQYDWAEMNAEIDQFGLTFSGFDFDFHEQIEQLTGEPDEEPDDDEDDEQISRLQHNVFENFERDFEPRYTGLFDIPVMKATQTTGSQFLRFCDWKECDDPENYIAHFYYDDFKFIKAWRDPDMYVDRLKRFKAVISPDFSLYTDFPVALQILSCYRRQWLGAYWQSLGIDVIPDVVWGNEDSFYFCYDGVPMHSVVAVSSVGVKRDKDWNGSQGDVFKKGFDEMMKRLEPTAVLFYGDAIDGLEGNIIQIPSFYAQRREMLNQKKRDKDNLVSK